VDSNNTILKTWVTEASVSLQRRDVYVIAPKNTAKIYFNYQQYNYKAVYHATLLPISNALPMPSRYDWKKNFRLQDNFAYVGQYIKAGTGVQYASDKWKTTDYISVSQGDVLRYRLKGFSSEQSAICFYDDKKLYVSDLLYSKTDGYYMAGTVTVAQSGYIRVTVVANDTVSWMIWDQFIPSDAIRASIEQTNVLAGFLQDEYDQMIESLENVSTVSGSSFIFLTDLHYSVNHAYANQQYMMERTYVAVKRLSDEYPISVVVAGGDYEQLGNIADGVVKQDGIDVINHMNRYMSQMNVPKIALCGNHELGYKSGGASATIAGTDNGLTVDEIYQYIGKKYALTDRIVKENNAVYYMLDTIGEVFYLFLSTPTVGGLAEQDNVTAIQNALVHNANKYPIVVLNHYSLTNSGAIFGHEITDTITSILSSGHTIIAWIGGHVHSDWCNTVTVNNTDVLVISCLQSGYLSSEKSQDGITYTHLENTPTESAFSVFTIDKEKGKLFLARFGAGVDREFNYNTISGAVGLVS
jgi:hypothetical protein